MSKLDELKDLLNQDIRQLATLAELLEKEKALLSGSDVKSLASVTDQKNQHLDQIRERAKTKIRVLVAIGFRPDQGDPSRFLRSAGLEDAVALWDQASQRLAQCQALNQVNGRVMSHLQKRLSRLTEIFRGATGQDKLYGAKGQEEAVSHSNVLASA
ncbi:flagella synthesis protein FlgN [Marinobacter confluentis]|uniref:Flagellar protein FlgN n=1 Tax=Marinobacter confluentis TaxID=1697557 RepID=A0A4Z1BWT6_9GAMM|nr:flagellar protein FlgN [Marinobacter confluentis]TGN41749.1 flagellar protein FlgN [Marinobacter confluentis]